MACRTGSFLVLFAVLAIPSTTLAQSKEFSRTVALDAGGELRLRAAKGSVRLTAWDRNDVQIDARIELTGFERFGGEYARQAVEATTVDVEGDRRVVSIRSNYDNVPTRGWNNDSRTIPAIHYVIQAPSRIDLNLDIDRSDTDISGFEGRLMIKIDRSELVARELGGTIRLSIDRGGASRLLGLRGAVDLEADRTDVLIDAERLDADSRIHADRGEIELRIPSAQPLRVRADLDRRGTFHSDFPLTRYGRRETLVEGTLNGGGPELRVGGDRIAVRLRKRD